MNPWKLSPSLYCLQLYLFTEMFTCEMNTPI
jgi:hypothetical protein